MYIILLYLKKKKNKIIYNIFVSINYSFQLVSLHIIINTLLQRRKKMNNNKRANNFYYQDNEERVCVFENKIKLLK